MFQYISGRRRCWKLLRELDPEIVLSEGHRADMLLDLAGLDKNERTMIQASIGNAVDFDKITEALVVQHPCVHLKGSPAPQGPKGGGKGSGKSKGTFSKAKERIVLGGIHLGMPTRQPKIGQRLPPTPREGTTRSLHRSSAVQPVVETYRY